MIITYWSDFTCPFCYIAEARLKQALSDLGIEGETRLDFKAFELNPNASTVPKRNVIEGFQRHYGISEAAAMDNIERINSLGRAEGLDFNYGTAHVTNTFDALRLAKLAQSKGYAMGHKYIDRMYKAFFGENLILSDHEVLKKLANEVGLDNSEVSDVLAGDQFSEEVRSDENESRRYGISAVPFFVVNGKYGIPGAVEIEDFKKILMKAYNEEEAGSDVKGMVCGPDGCKPRDRIL